MNLDKFYFIKIWGMGVLYVLIACIIFILLSCSSSKNKRSVIADTLRNEVQRIIPVKDMERKGFVLAVGDSLVTPNGSSYTRIDDKFYVSKEKENFILRTEYKSAPRKIKIINHNQVRINSDNKVKEVDKSQIDNSSKVNSDNIDKKNKVKVHEVENVDSNNRWKLKIGGLPWWIWLILILAAIGYAGYSYLNRKNII